LTQKRGSLAPNDSRGNSNPVICRNLLQYTFHHYTFTGQVWIARKERKRTSITRKFTFTGPRWRAFLKSSGLDRFAPSSNDHGRTYYPIASCYSNKEWCWKLSHWLRPTFSHGRGYNYYNFIENLRTIIDSLCW